MTSSALLDAAKEQVPASHPKVDDQLRSPEAQAQDLVFDPPYLVLDSTTFQHGLQEIQLAGIEGPHRDAVCNLAMQVFAISLFAVRGDVSMEVLSTLLVALPAGNCWASALRACTGSPIPASRSSPALCDGSWAPAVIACALVKKPPRMN